MNRPLASVFLLIASLCQSGAAAQSSECGASKDKPCDVALGSYYAVEPATTGDGLRPAVIFFHGGGGWGARILKMRKAMTEAFTARGYVVLAPNGKKRPGSRFGPGWSFIPQFEPQRDELAFVREVIGDAQSRFNIDPQRVLMTGYSIGGSLTSYLACKDPGVAAAFAPVAGGFWKPHPSDCAGPVRLLHTHGWRDQTVPLEGRPLRTLKNDRGRVEQGDIYQTLKQWRIENDCTKYRPDKFITDGPFWRRIWTHCAPGTALEFALHPGGHSVPKEWPTLAMDWFENLPLQR
jgi:polyhydroxybutyrate depolymerase